MTPTDLHFLTCNPQVKKWRSRYQENVSNGVGKIYGQKTTYSALYLIISFPDTVSAPLTVNISIILILPFFFSFLPLLFIVYLGLTLVSSLSPCLCRFTMLL